jgi:peptide/nickel transport system permease protein
VAVSRPIGAREAVWRRSRSHPIASLVARRAVLGILTLLLASVLVFAATQVLPGNAATAVLRNTGSAERVAALERQLHLNDPAGSQYVQWITGLLSGDPGNSLANREPVEQIVMPRVENSAVLVLLAGSIGALLGVALGVAAAARRGGWFDHAVSVGALTFTALPEFLVALFLVICFATVWMHVLPAVSEIPPGTSPWSNPESLVLPVATLVMMILPYVFRMTRAAMVEALESDYVEMARMKGMSARRVLFLYAFPNVVPTVVQVIGLCLLYLAGGIVVVEYVFNYPGVGQQLVAAVTDRDIPVIQFVVMLLAGFYVVVNIGADVIALIATPRRRLPRSG